MASTNQLLTLIQRNEKALVGVAITALTLYVLRLQFGSLAGAGDAIGKGVVNVLGGAAGQAHNLGREVIKPVTDPIGKAIADLRFGAPGSGVQATESYIVLRRRDFTSGSLSESAYIASLSAHPNNIKIWQSVLTPTRTLREPYKTALTNNDPVIITPDLKINTF
ncbi:MAG: hypothetical protein ACK4GU_13440 [Alishewanella aestuarii]